MGIIKYKLVLVALSFIFAEGTKSCTGELPSFGYIDPIVKPFVVIGEMIASSPAPLIGAIKKAPTWFQKNEEEVTEEMGGHAVNPKTQKNNTDTEQEEVQPGKINKRENPQFQEEVDKKLPMKGEEISVLDTEKSVEQDAVSLGNSGDKDIQKFEEPEGTPKEVDTANPIQQNPDLEVDLQKVIKDPSAIQQVPQPQVVPIPQHTVSDEEKRKYIESIDALKNAIDALDLEAMNGRFRQSTRTTLSKVETLNLKIKNKKSSSNIKKIKEHLSKLNTSGANNESIKEKMVQAVEELKKQANEIIPSS